jgi:hypothetical protein
MPVRGVGKCPPGVFCLSPGLVTILVLIGLGALAAWALWRPADPTPIQPLPPAGPVGPPVSVQISTAQLGSGGGDDRYTRAPKPERHWYTEPDLPSNAEIFGKLPRVPTRGLPEQYQSMGVLKMEDGALLPLYGRRTAARSDRFQYYTRTDTYNPVQLPISYKRRDCQDDVGCDELMNGETVNVQPLNMKGSATIYRFDGPTYVPGIL